MIPHQLFTSVVSLAVSLIIFGVACAQDQQKKPERQQPQKVISPARPNTAPAPCLQPPRAPAQTVRPPVTQSLCPTPSQIRSQNQIQQPPRPPAQVHPSYQPQCPPTGQAVAPKSPMVQSRPGQPVYPLSKPTPPSSPQQGKKPEPRPQPAKITPPHPQAGTPTTPLLSKEKAPNAGGSPQVSPQNSSKKQGDSAKGSTATVSTPSPQKKAEPVAQPGTKPEAGPKEAAKKTAKAVSAEEKQKNQKEPSKKELLKDLERELGHKPDSKYDKMSSKELQKALGKVKESKSAPATAESGAPAAGKQKEPGASPEEPPGAKEKVASAGAEQKHEAPKSQEKLADMSRKELRDALSRESGEKLGDKYNQMSKNELKKELEGLRAKKSPQENKDKNLAQNELKNTGDKGSGDKSNQTAEEKYKRVPQLANVKWSDNELRKHIKDNLDTSGDKYDKNKYEKMSRKDLEQAYSKIHSQAEKQEVKDKIKDKLKDLGEKYDSKKYDKLSSNELEKKYDGLKEKTTSTKDSPHEKLENLSRKELTDAIAKEKGEPLNDHYKKMSKNGLANELATLKEKGGSTKASSNNPESLTKNELKDHIKQLSESLGEKYKSNYDKQSQRELVTSYKALAAEKAQKDAMAKKQHGSEQPTPQSHSVLQQPGQPVGASPATSGPAPAQAGSQQELLKRRDELKADLLNKDKGNVKEANRLRNEVESLNKQILTNEKGQAANTGLGVVMSGGDPLTTLNQIGIQGGSLLSDKYLSGSLKDGMDKTILGWRTTTDVASIAHGDPSGALDLSLMIKRQDLEKKRDDDLNRMSSLGTDPETRKLRDDYHKLLQQIGTK